MKRIATLAVALLPLTSLAAPVDGAYFGAFLGYAQAEDQSTSHSQFTGARTGWAQTTNPEGEVYGGLAGYNWRLNEAWTTGVELDAEGRNNDSDRTQQKLFGVTSPIFAAATKIEWAASLRARIGYQLTPEALVYATGGFAQASVKRTYYSQLTSTKESHSGTQDGWTAGLGMDYQLNESMSARVEYRYTDYGTKKTNANLWGEYYNNDLTEDSIRVGVTYAF